MNVLVVDDEKLIRDVIKEYLIQEHYNIYEASNGQEAIEIVKNNNIDLVILDIMMPVMDGYKCCEHIKEIKSIPVIMLSARQEEQDKLLGFKLGIDDYMSKPFSPKELVARIKAVSKRNNSGDLYIYKGLIIDYKGHTVKINDKLIDLTPKEYDLLCFLIKNEGVALSREVILNKVWNYNYYGEDRTIDTHIKKLRRSLQEYKNLITTVRGVGYKFETK